MSKISKNLLSELKQILKEDHGIELSYQELEKMGYSLIGYFDLLVKINKRLGFVNSSVSLIDTRNSLSKIKGKD